MIDSLALLYAPAGAPAMARLGGQALLVGRHAAHLLSINDYRLDLPLSSGHWLVTRHHDRPGIIGAVGQLLGDATINIGFMQLGRDEPRGMALMVVGVDASVPDDVVMRVEALPPLARARRVT
jgi:L-serine deaminase